MINSLVIDGQDFTQYIESGISEGFTVSYLLNTDSNTVGREISETILLNKKAYEYLKERFTDCTKESDVIVQTDCCNGLQFNYVIDAYSLTDICEKPYCVVGIQLKDTSAEIDQERCLSNSLVEREGYNDNIINPLIQVCDISRGFKSTLYRVLKTIEDTLNGIPLVTVDFGLEGIIGCSYQNVFNIKEVLTYHIERCGLSLNSDTFLNDESKPFDCLSIMPILFDEGWEDCETAGNNIEANEINLTVTQLLEELSTFFKLDYRIKNNVLYLEKESFFDESPVFNVSLGHIDDLEVSEDTPICYNYILDDDTNCKVLGMKYKRGDFSGSTVNYYYDHNEDINLNKPERLRKGYCTSPTDRTFSYVRIYGQLQTDPIYLNDVLGQSGNDFIGTVNITDSISSDYKLLILDKPYTCPANISNFNEDLKLENIYDCFYNEDDNCNCKKELKPFTFLMECVHIEAIKENNIDVYIDSDFGRIKSTEINVNFENKTIEFAEPYLVSCA